jgi:ribonuclease Z
MPTLYFLGTGAAATDAHRTTTMLAFADAGTTFAVDCGGDLVQRLQAAGIGLGTVDGLYLTHEHPDHVGGFPLFMEKIWIAGRTAPLPLYGILPAIDQARRCLGSFDIGHWDLPEMQWHEVAHEENALVLDDDTWRITAAPGVHAVPVTGLRVESKATGGVVAYSCDTEPTPAITRLARGADILVHEATGGFKGHTSPEDAAAVAAEAGVGRLVLIHLPPGCTEEGLAEARSIFPNTAWAEELGTLAF